jgi:hypothetical protein
MHDPADETRNCIERCLRCYAFASARLMNHCLEAGGKHTEPGTFV